LPVGAAIAGHPFLADRTCRADFPARAGEALDALLALRSLRPDRSSNRRHLLESVDLREDRAELLADVREDGFRDPGDERVEFDVGHAAAFSMHFCAIA